MWSAVIITVPSVGNRWLQEPSSMRLLPCSSCQQFDHKNDRCRHCSVGEDEDDMFYMILLRGDFLPFDKL